MSVGRPFILDWKLESIILRAFSTSIRVCYSSKKKKKKPIGLVLTVADDIEALEYGNKYIKALIPAVVNMVYKKLLEHDITARVFMTYDTSNEKPIEDFFNEESPQIKRRKMFLRWYLIKICSDPTQMEFWRYLNKVG